MVKSAPFGPVSVFMQGSRSGALTDSRSIGSNRPVPPRTTSTVKKAADSRTTITGYAKAQPAKQAAICEFLESAIWGALPKAEAKIWHSMPVWFIGQNPVVGYKASAKQVNLLFW